jgi:beta-lactam-binding protein with PASTA domain
VAVPNVIGMKIAAARSTLRSATLPAISLNTACNKGTLASQSVVSSLSIPGKAPTFDVGAVPLSPGMLVAPGTRVAITWSGCFGDSVEVPVVVGLTLAAARHTLRAVGLNWACYSAGHGTTTTSAPPMPTTTSDPATTTTEAPKAPQTVLTQSPAAHASLRPGATVSLTMHRCPQ